MTDHDINSEDKIALPGFKAIIKEMLILFFRTISFVNFVVRKWKFVILSGLILGIVLGYVYYSTKPALYEVSMIVVYNDLSKKTYAQIIDQLDRLTTTGSREELASELKISRETAGSILSIDSKNINNEPLRNDTSSKTKQPFIITLALSNNKLDTSLQTAIVNYINNGPYLKKLKDDQRKSSLNKILFIDKELQKLDSLKNEYTRFLASSRISATFYNNAFNPADIYIHSSELVNQKELMLTSLNIDGTAVSVIDGFKITSSPQSASLLKYLFGIGGIGLFAGLILGLFMEARKKIIRN